jgi:hypothetical protein
MAQKHSSEEKKQDMIDGRSQMPQAHLSLTKPDHDVLSSVVKLPDPPMAASSISESDSGRKVETRPRSLSPSIDFKTWFTSFINAVDHAEVWDEIKLVLEEGKSKQYLSDSIEWEDDQYTPLHYAAQVGDEEVVKALIEEYIVPLSLKTGICQRTAMHLAALRGHLLVVKYLMSKGGDWNSSDSTKANVLHYAALGTQGQYNTAVVEFFLNEMKIDPMNTNAMLPGNINLLHLAVEAENMTLVRYLVKKCPQLAHEEDGHGTLPSQLARTEEIKKAIEESLQNTDPCE